MMRNLGSTLLLCLALGLLILPACQADAVDLTPVSPAPSVVEEPVADEAPDEVETVASPTVAAVEEPMDEVASEVVLEESVTPPAEAPPAEESSVGNADVEFVRATQAADGAWRFDVTVRHPDTGWEDYADGWDVVTPDGRVLKADDDDPFTRLLLHPHENEQPFTRSQSGIVVPGNVTVVIVRAHDLVDGFGGQEIEVDLMADQGPGYEVSRP